MVASTLLPLCHSATSSAFVFWSLSMCPHDIPSGRSCLSHGKLAEGGGKNRRLAPLEWTGCVQKFPFCPFGSHFHFATTGLVLAFDSCLFLFFIAFFHLPLLFAFGMPIHAVFVVLDIVRNRCLQSFWAIVFVAEVNGKLT